MKNLFNTVSTVREGKKLIFQHTESLKAPEDIVPTAEGEEINMEDVNKKFKDQNTLINKIREAEALYEAQEQEKNLDRKKAIEIAESRLNGYLKTRSESQDPEVHKLVREVFFNTLSDDVKFFDTEGNDVASTEIDLSKIKSIRIAETKDARAPGETREILLQMYKPSLVEVELKK